MTIYSINCLKKEVLYYGYMLCLKYNLKQVVPILYEMPEYEAFDTYERKSNDFRVLHYGE